MNYAAMAATGVAVDVGTTIIASIAFGIGIDYSIHFLSSIERQVKAGEKDLIMIMQKATKTVGIPIVINSLTLAGGFLVLLASNFLVLQLLGLFIAMTMLISAFNALVLIPLLYFLWHRNSDRFAEGAASAPA
jgi:predicted RND superfamily exporter protein